MRVEVTAAALLPAAFVRTKHEPDKAALLAALKAGQTIPRRRSWRGATRP